MAEETIMQRLARAFPAEVVKVKPGRGGSKPLSYISHALVTERLNEVDPSWSWRVLTEHIWHDQGGAPHCAGVTVEMTVNGVTRVEAGGPQRQEAFTNEIKNAYSDAIKRAAMRFGVALYIWDNLVDAQDDDDALPEHAASAPRDAAQRAPGPASRPVTPPARSAPLSAPRARATMVPNGPEEQRRKLVEAAQARGVNLTEDMESGDMAAALNAALASRGLGVRVIRGEDGTATARALHNALMAFPPRTVDTETGEVHEDDPYAAVIGKSDDELRANLAQARFADEGR